MERKRRQAPIRIPQFNNPESISIQNIGDYVGLEDGPTATFVRNSVGADVVDELRKPARIASPYSSAISARLPEAERMRSALTQIRDSYAGLVRRFAGTQHEASYREWLNSSNALIQNWSPQRVDVGQLRQFFSRFGNGDVNWVRQKYGLDPQAAIAAITDIQSLSQAQSQFDAISNPNATTLSDSEREALRQKAADKLRVAATQFNREQDQGNVAASAIRTTGQRPLIGRFGTPQTGVGIAARGAL